MLEGFWVRNDRTLMHAYTEDDGDSWVRDVVLDANVNANPSSVTAVSRNANSMVVAWITIYAFKRPVPEAWKFALAIFFCLKFVTKDLVVN
ncbi:hypothetical protein PENSUB_1227 [Penicillium subrubescens]|uniref:Uncharacterized protein n=1 Tax=Penicillium subrubescens TaxID=1316194 RepID=A0A1Q5UKX8_9EURO|nr:hypothetical protein PENSUB_1227 [Penicillium subrubescens]